MLRMRIMNRALSAILCIVLMLGVTGCSGRLINIGFSNYYDTPKEAYLSDPYRSLPSGVYYDNINQEIACVSITPNDVLWIARVNNDYIIATFLNVKNDSYQTSGRSELYNLSSREFDSDDLVLDKHDFSSYSLSSKEVVNWQFCFFESETQLELNDEKYLSDSYEIRLESNTVYLTLIYFVQ